MSVHRCPAPGCQKQVPSTMLACRAHWYSLPRELRDDVWKAWRNGAGQGSPEHTEAVHRAITWLENTT